MVDNFSQLVVSGFQFRRSYWPLTLVVALLLHAVPFIRGSHSHLIYFGNSTDLQVDDDGSTRRLTFVKMGVAVGMFTITAIACGLPLLVLTCITRRAQSRARYASAITPATDSDWVSSSSGSRGEGPSDSNPSSTTYLLSPPVTEPEELLSPRENPSQLPPVSTSTATHRLQRNIPSRGVVNTEVEDRRASENEGGMPIERSSLHPVVKTPRRLESHQRINVIHKWVGRINCFAAGIFLTTGLMDLFPEVQDAMTIALSALQINSNYPFSALFTLLGFFIVLSVEQGIHICHTCRQRRGSFGQPSAVANTGRNRHGEQRHSHLPPGGRAVGEGIGESSLLHIMLLLVALSVHSVFEGLAVGLQSNIPEVVGLFTALLLHKLIMAASIGVSLATAREQQVGGITRSQWIGALTFSLASPVGVLIGWALIAQRSSPALLVVIAMLQGLACGTFFFVVFCEVLPHEFVGENHKVRDRFGKVISLFLGFVLVAGYIAFAPE